MARILYLCYIFLMLSLFYGQIQSKRQRNKELIEKNLWYRVAGIASQHKKQQRSVGADAVLPSRKMRCCRTIIFDCSTNISLLFLQIECVWTLVEIEGK